MYTNGFGDSFAPTNPYKLDDDWREQLKKSIAEQVFTVSIDPGSVPSVTVQDLGWGSKHKNDACDALKYALKAGEASCRAMKTRLWIPFDLQIKNVIFNDPATIVFWSDGTKTVVKCAEGDTFDQEKGLAMAILKKLYGNDNTYHQFFKKWVPKKKTAKEAIAEAAKKLRKTLDKLAAKLDSNVKEK